MSLYETLSQSCHGTAGEFNTIPPASLYILHLCVTRDVTRDNAKLPLCLNDFLSCFDRAGREQGTGWDRIYFAAVQEYLSVYIVLYKVRSSCGEINPILISVVVTASPMSTLEAVEIEARVPLQPH